MARHAAQAVTLVTGANGEIGHALVHRLAAAGRSVVTIDIAELDPRLSPSSTARSPGRSPTPHCSNACWPSSRSISSSIWPRSVNPLGVHPVTAHQVNVDGTLALLEFAQHEGESHGRPVVFVYPSSIAAYGLPDQDTKTRPAACGKTTGTRRDHVRVQQAVLRAAGRYYAHYYKQLAAKPPSGVDFRCVRFPGLISALTVPSGGTSDYAPEMIHAAARCEHYTCFVRPDTRIPFMAMPDAVDALLGLARHPPAA
jgi:nucleoside-diphosphate-sugar epimerase